MLALSTTFFVAALSSGVVANFNLLAEFVPQTFEARSVRPAGGFSLSLNSQESCPAGSPPCGATWCCPGTLTCNPTGSKDIAEVCCPGEIDCISAFQATPFCADDSWSLWNATTDAVDAAGYFCCLPGQSGMQDGTCVSSDQISSPTQLAVQLGAGSSGTVTPSSTTSAGSSSASSTTSAGSSSASSSASSHSASTTASETTSSSASSKASSASSKATDSSATSAGKESTTATPTSGKGTSSGSGSTATSSAASSSSSAAAATATGSGERNAKAYGTGLMGCVMAIGFAVGIF